VAEQAIASIVDGEVGAVDAGQVGEGEVVVPPVRIGEGEEVKRETRGLQIPLEG
jgi:hypothetical protein